MAKKQRKFEYKPRSRQQVEARASQSGKQYDRIFQDGVTKFTPKSEGGYKLRILPPTWNDPEHFGYDIFVHYQVGPNNQNYLCPYEHGIGPCPICEERARALQEGEDDYAGSLRATKRVAVYAIDRSNEDEGPQIWDMPWTFDRDIAPLMEDVDTGEVTLVDHPEEGRDLSFRREGQGRNTTYPGKRFSQNPSPIHRDEDKMEAWLDYIEDNPIPDMLQFYSYERINEVFSLGLTSGEEADSPSGSFRQQMNSSNEPDDGDDESDDGDDEDEDTEVVKTAASSDDETEQEESRPSSRRRRRRRTEGVASKLEADS